MIKQGLKNFISCLKYTFSALGVLLFCMLIGASCFFSDASEAAALFKEEAGAAISDVRIYPDEFVSFLADKALGLNWSDPVSALRQICDRKQIFAAVEEGLKASVPDYEAHAEALASAVGKAGKDVVGAAIRFILWSATGAIAGFFLTHALVRRSVAPRKDLKTSLLAALYGSVFPLAVMGGTLWLTGIFRLNSTWQAVAFLVVTELSLLFSACLVQGAGKVRLKDAVSAKNLCGLLAAAIIVFAVILLITVVISLLCGAFVGTVAFYALFTVGFFTSQMHAESFVKTMAEKNPSARK